MLKRPALRGILVFILFAFPVLGGVDRWTIHGPFGANVARLCFDPADPSIAYAATDNGLFRSSDSGEHWTAASELLGTPISDVAVSASDPQRVFASSVYGFYRSADRGVTWTLIHSFGSFGVAISPKNPDVVYSVSTGGLIRSTDGGVTFGNTGTGRPSAPPRSIVIDPTDDNVLYALYLTNDGVYRSGDGGATWTPANSGLTLPIYYSLAIHPSNSATLYAAGGGGIFKTTNGGGAWTQLAGGLPAAYCYSLATGSSTPETLIAGTSRGLFRTSNGGVTWSGPYGDATVSAVAVSPLDSLDVLLETTFQVFRSTNGGIQSTLSSSGLTAHYTNSIAADPRDGAVVYAAGPAGIFKSTDRGRSWASIGSTSSSIVFVDPFQSQTLYAFSGVLRRSVDGGTAWESYTVGLPPEAVTVLVADPVTEGTLYAIVGATTLYRKTSGARWSLRSSGLPSGSYSFFVVDPRTPSTLYIGGAAGFFRSVDAGETWNPANRPLGVSPAGIAVDPFDSNHLLLWSSQATYESTDGGANWNTAAGLQSVRTIVFDPTAAGRIYAVSYASLVRSLDGGKTWSPFVLGFGRTVGGLLAVAPGGKTLYVGGANGGVWVRQLGRGRAVRK